MLQILLRASVEGAILVALVWTAVRMLPALSPSTRALLWWCAAAKFVVALVWVVPVEIAVLPHSPAGAPALGTSATAVAATGALSAVTAMDPAPPGGAGPDARFGVAEALLAAWCAGLAAALLMLARRWQRSTGILRRASAAPPYIQDAVVELAEQLALRRAPEVRMSADVQTPLVAGLRRATVLLPHRFVDFSPLQQRMALCHELMHVKRGDLWIGWVPALAERLFFFHPLVRLAAREYLFWRESACDAAVLETLDAAPREYGRLLLDLGIVPPRPRLAAAGASWSFSNLQRRIHMLCDLPRAPRSRSSRLVASAAVLMALCAAVPMRLVARAPAAPDPAPPAGGLQQSSAREQQPPVPAAPPAPPAAPARPAEPPRRALESDDSLEPNYVLFMGEGDERVHMSGSREDVDHARTFRRGNEPMLWFRDRRGEFVIRDGSVLRQAETIWKPVAQLGDRLGQLGAEQGQLGARMAELGAAQGQVGAEQGRIGARQGALGAKQAYLATEQINASESRRAELERTQRQLDAEMRALDEQMKAMTVKMRDAEKPVQELSAKMEALGDEMSKLGKEMEQTAGRARAQLRELLDRAVASGAAQAVK